ncbi:hypothetical protein CAL65_18845 [Alkalilimnicola ehrlichii]|uniref:Uncharacterized protein n=3 Tax=Alkalilimnicola ehrlichii TaxID=351052 RepID=A0A3E0WIT8_9GAMM|nr:hypothetical protein CAL65_18845 [Alkalilimnicola ehrlichii]
MLFLALLVLPASVAAEVVRAYPAAYEVIRYVNEQREVLVSGEVLLQRGRTVRVEQHSPVDTDADIQAARVNLSFTTRPEEGDTGRVWIDSAVELALNKGMRRIGLDNGGNNFIAGENVVRIRFDSSSLQSIGNPAPIEVDHRADGARYQLTLMFVDDGAR